MNQVVTQEQVRPARPPMRAGGALAAIVPQDLAEAFRLSDAIHKAGMAPYGLETAEKVMIAMLAGIELGMPPMQSVQSVAVINNRPCMWGDGLIAVVRNSSLCMFVREWMEGTGDERTAFCETQRRGEDTSVVRSFSVDDAKRAGLWQTQERVTKKRRDGGTYETANDSPWFKYPQRMLQMRARAWCLRDVYPDVLKGMQSREEVEDYAHADPTPALPATVPLEERLRIARSTSAESDEGFDPAHVARETDTLAGEAAEQEYEPSGASPSSPDEGSGAAIPPADPAPTDTAEPDAGDQAGAIEADHGDAAAPATDLYSPVACLKAFMTTATDADLSVTDKRDTLEQMKEWWKDALPAHLDFVRSCLQTCDKVAKGELKEDAARKYLEGLLRPSQEAGRG